MTAKATVEKDAKGVFGKLKAAFDSPKGRIAIALFIAVIGILYVRARQSATAASGVSTGVDPLDTTSADTSSLYGGVSSDGSGGTTTATVDPTTLTDDGSLVASAGDISAINAALADNAATLNANGSTLAGIADGISNLVSPVNTPSTPIVNPSVVGVAAPTVPAPAAAKTTTAAQAPGVQKYAPKDWKVGVSEFFKANGKLDFINGQGNIAEGVAQPKKGTVIH